MQKKQVHTVHKRLWLQHFNYIYTKMSRNRSNIHKP